MSYSFFLENYDSGWSEYSPMSYKEYTHLPEGQYLMHVRSFNSFNRTTSEAVMTICILPPWYRSTAAKIVYLLLVLSLLLSGILLVQTGGIQGVASGGGTQGTGTGGYAA